jgi:predicted alpha/beta-hydrolase family hydrolase
MTTLGIMQTLVPTPAGEARITRYPARGRRRALLALGHGAGGGVEASDLQALAAALPAHGVEVALVEQPWRVSGRRIAPAPKTLDIGWVSVVELLREDITPSRGRARKVPLIVGGRSAGARVACRTGLATGAAGVLALAFPLHPPGKPEKSRADELLATGLPTLVVQGAADSFGTPSEFPKLPKTHRLVGLAAGNHSFAVRKDQDPVLDAVVEAVAGWITTLI